LTVIDLVSYVPNIGHDKAEVKGLTDKHCL
jgi:hypothetical protein